MTEKDFKCSHLNYCEFGTLVYHSYKLICYLQRFYMKLFEDASWYSSTRTEAVLMPELNEMGS